MQKLKHKIHFCLSNRYMGNFFRVNNKPAQEIYHSDKYHIPKNNQAVMHFKLVKMKKVSKVSVALLKVALFLNFIKYFKVPIMI